MKTEGKMLDKKRRKAIKGETMEVSQNELNALFNGKRDKPKNKFKEIKLGSVTLCDPVKGEWCRFSNHQTNYCWLFEKELNKRKDSLLRLPECKEAFGKQMILTGE